METEERKALFMRLARENECALVRVARRLCWQNRDMADDCVQEAIVSAYRAFVDGKFQDVANFRPWIMKILVNAFLRENAKNPLGRKGRDVALLDDQTSVDLSQRPDQALLDGCLSEDLGRAVGSLSPEQRKCVELVDILDLDYAEAATILKVPIGTVRSRLARARLQMAEILTAAPDPDTTVTER